jgi:AcrR family transcriptional regulator
MRTPQARSVRTRAALLEAAALSFSASGWEGTHAKGIAAAAGVSVGSFYAYFPDKAAALRELADARFRSVLAGLARHLPHDVAAVPDERALRATLATVVAEVIELHRQDPGLHAVYTERRHVDPELDALTTAMEHQVVSGLAAALARWGVTGDPEATAFVCFGLVEGAVHAHVIGHPMVDDARLQAAAVEALVAIVLSTRGQA